MPFVVQLHTRLSAVRRDHSLTIELFLFPHVSTICLNGWMSEKGHMTRASYHAPSQVATVTQHLMALEGCTLVDDTGSLSHPALPATSTLLNASAWEEALCNHPDQSLARYDAGSFSRLALRQLVPFSTRVLGKKHSAITPISRLLVMTPARSAVFHCDN